MGLALAKYQMFSSILIYHPKGDYKRLEEILRKSGIEADIVPEFHLLEERLFFETDTLWGIQPDTQIHPSLTLQASPVSVLVLPALVGLSEQFKKLWNQKIRTTSPHPLLILVDDPEIQNHELQEVATLTHPSLILESFSDPHWIDILKQTLLKALTLQEEKQRQEAFLTHRNQLQNEEGEYKNKLKDQARQIKEEESNQKQNQWIWKILKTVHEALHQGQTLSQLEYLLTETLKKQIPLEFLRIILFPIDSNQALLLPNAHRIPLVTSLDDRPLGSLFLLHQKTSASPSWSPLHLKIFQSIAELLSLSLERILKLEEAEILGQQWISTFNAIPHPICLKNENNQVLQGNLAFKDSLKRKDNTFNQEEKIYEISHHVLPPTGHSKRMYIEQYIDITEKTQMETRILDTAKWVQMGTIGSSIAHELNNPLGGILFLLQFLGKEAHLPREVQKKILPMETEVRRCLDVVKNLLDFSRLKPGVDSQYTPLDLRMALQRGVQILKIKSHNFGIDFRLNLPNYPCQVNGNLNELIMVFHSILRIPLLQAKLSPQAFVAMDVLVMKKKHHWLVEFTDNLPLDAHLHHLKTDLSLPRFVEDILHRHGAQIQNGHSKVSQKQKLRILFPQISS